MDTTEIVTAITLVITASDLILNIVKAILQRKKDKETNKIEKENLEIKKQSQTIEQAKFAMDTINLLPSLMDSMMKLGKKMPEPEDLSKLIKNLTEKADKYKDFKSS